MTSLKQAAKAATIAVLSSAGASAPATAQVAPDAKKLFTLVVHGGSGTITRQTITHEIESQFRAALERALLAGHAVLAAGGSALDAVVATVKVFEGGWRRQGCRCVGAAGARAMDRRPQIRHGRRRRAGRVEAV